MYTNRYVGSGRVVRSKEERNPSHRQARLELCANGRYKIERWSQPRRKDGGNIRRLRRHLLSLLYPRPHGP